MKREQQNQEISALIDGELPPTGLGAVVDALERDPELAARWERYHMISAVLHGEAVRHEVRAVASTVAERLAAEPTVLAPRVPWRRAAVKVPPVAGAALAAGVAVVAVLAAPMFIDSQGGINGPGSMPVAVNPPPATPDLMLTEYGSRWHINEPDLESKLDRLLVTHQEYAPASGMKGLLPFATVVGYEAGR